MCVRVRFGSHTLRAHWCEEKRPNALAGRPSFFPFSKINVTSPSAGPGLLRVLRRPASPPPTPVPPQRGAGPPGSPSGCPIFYSDSFQTACMALSRPPSAAPVPPLPPDPTLGGRTLRTEAGAHGLTASPGPQPGAWWEPLQGCPRGNSRPLHPSCSSRQPRPPQPSADQRRTAGPFQGPCSLNPGRATEEGTRGASGRGGRGQRRAWAEWAWTEGAWPEGVWGEGGVGRGGVGRGWAWAEGL